MMPSPAAARTIQPAAVPLPATGRGTAGGAAAESFASLLGGEPQAVDAPPVAVTADGSPASERQDDAAGGSAMPSTDPALPANADASWLAMILAGPTPAALPASGQVLSPQQAMGGVTPSNAKTSAIAAPAMSTTAARPGSQIPAPPIAATDSFPPLQSFNDIAPASVAAAPAGATPTAAPVISSLPLPPATGVAAPLPPTGAEALQVLPAAPSTIAAPSANIASTSLNPDLTTIASTPPAASVASIVTTDRPASPIAIGGRPRAAPPAVTPPTVVVPPQPAALSARFDTATPPVIAAAAEPAPPMTPGQAAPVAQITALPAQAGVAPAPAGIAGPARTTAPTAPPAPTTVPAPASSSPAPAPAAPAGQVFAAAIHAAGRAEADDVRDADPIAAQQAALLTAPTSTAGAVTAANGRGDASLDMRRENWPSAMVDHIERLRDAANAADTSIRLVPDALGSIDVSLSRHDGGVRVSLNAHQPATQALLAEARPQLTELAQARGIRLTDTGGGTSGQGFGDAQRQPRIPVAMPGAPASAVTDDRDPADSRVA